MSVEVIYAEVARAWRVDVPDAAGYTVGALLARLPALTKGWPAAALSPAAVAVFGREVDATTLLRDGDRLELLRALPNDPKLARRARAGTTKPR
jgi:hypothetical protein